MIVNDIAIRDRTCHSCQTSIKKQTPCIKVYIRGKARSFCVKCVAKALFKTGVTNLDELLFTEML